MNNSVATLKELADLIAYLGESPRADDSATRWIFNSFLIEDDGMLLKPKE